MIFFKNSSFNREFSTSSKWKCVYWDELSQFQSSHYFIITRQIRLYFEYWYNIYFQVEFEWEYTWIVNSVHGIIDIVCLTNFFLCLTLNVWRFLNFFYIIADNSWNNQFYELLNLFRSSRIENDIFSWTNGLNCFLRGHSAHALIYFL